MGRASKNWLLEEESDYECLIQAHVRGHSTRKKLSDTRIFAQYCMHFYFPFCEKVNDLDMRFFVPKGYPGKFQPEGQNPGNSRGK